MDSRSTMFGLIALAILAAAPLSSESPKVIRLEIVDRSIDFHGGDLFRSTQTHLRQCSLSGCYAMRVRVNGGLFEYEVTRESDGRRARVTNDTAQSWVDGKPVTVTGEDAASVRSWVDARVYFPFLPFRLNDDSVFKQDMGLVDWNGRSLHLVKVSFVADSSAGSSSEYLYWFDPKTARMVQYAYSFEGTPGGLRLRQADNYRRIGGLLFSDQENLGIDADGLDIDLITADWAAAELRPISRVDLVDIQVRPIGSN